MHVVRRLRRCPERHLAVRGALCHGRMLFHRQVRVPFEEDDVLPHVFRARQRGVRVAEFKRHRLMHI